jgi:hypothetical protein
MTAEWRGPGYWLRVPSGDPDYPIRNMTSGNSIFTRDEALEIAAVFVAAANAVTPDAEGD